MEVEVTGPSRDLHSGTFGGAVANPVNITCADYAKMHDEEGRVQFPDFTMMLYRLLILKEINSPNLISPKKSIKNILMLKNFGEKKVIQSLKEPAQDQPLIVMVSGEGSMVPEQDDYLVKASAKISMRLVGNSEPDKN